MLTGNYLNRLVVILHSHQLQYLYMSHAFWCLSWGPNLLALCCVSLRQCFRRQSLYSPGDFSMIAVVRQVYARDVFHDHWLILRRFEEARLLREGSARAVSLEEAATEAFRGLYRTSWNLPHTREVSKRLANGCDPSIFGSWGAREPLEVDIFMLHCLL